MHRGAEGASWFCEGGTVMKTHKASPHRQLRKYYRSRRILRVRTESAVSEGLKRRISPEEFYREALGRLTGRGPWRTVRCPFHRPDAHPSLRVNIESGGFRCMACGARGGSIIAFVMLQDGLTFEEALRAVAQGGVQ